MKNNENDIIDIPTELEIEEQLQEVETLEILEDNDIIEKAISENVPSQNENISIDNPLIKNNKISTEVESKNMPESPQVLETAVQQPSIVIEEQNINQPQNLELNAVSLENNENMINLESIDGNPDELDIEVKGLNNNQPKRFKISLRLILLIILALAVIVGGGYWYYNYLLDKKGGTIGQKKSDLQIIDLSPVNSFEEAYNKVSAEFNTSSKTDKLKYTVNNGSLEITNKDEKYKATIKDVIITSVSNLKNTNNKDIIGLKDNKNNYYFVEINHNIKEDVEFNYKNNKLLTLNNDGSINNIAIAEYLNNKGYFYLAEKESGDFFISEDNGNITDISEVYLNVYSGVNIDFNDLKVAEEDKEKLSIDGIGLFYNGSLYIYTGNISEIKEIEVQYNKQSLKCSQVYLAYGNNLEFLDLYIITEDNSLYQMNLLTQEFDKTKIELLKNESLVKDHSIVEKDGIYTLEIVLENDDKISIK